MYCRGICSIVRAAVVVGVVVVVVVVLDVVIVVIVMFVVVDVVLVDLTPPWRPRTPRPPPMQGRRHSRNSSGSTSPSTSIVVPIQLPPEWPHTSPGDTVDVAPRIVFIAHTHLIPSSIVAALASVVADVLVVLAVVCQGLRRLAIPDETREITLLMAKKAINTVVDEVVWP